MTFKSCMAETTPFAIQHIPRIQSASYGYNSHLHKVISGQHNLP